MCFQDKLKFSFLSVVLSVFQRYNIVLKLGQRSAQVPTDVVYLHQFGKFSFREVQEILFVIFLRDIAKYIHLFHIAASQ